ncbi:MAG: 3-hydroxyacyl-CoA dehydrogenase family protein [Bacteroidota bacterium]
MKILVLADSKKAKEFELKFDKTDNVLDFSSTYLSSIKDYNTYDVIFDALFDEEIEPLENILNSSFKLLFLNSIKTSLAEINQFIDLPKEKVLGFNGLTTFVDRKNWEVTSLDGCTENSKAYLEQLGIEYSVCEDRPGMIGPRVISMIINEAYYTVMEGTAGKSDIDKAMKLGTNYPFGPFEWCESIGLADVYELLEALYQETKDERYKISPLMRSEYLGMS